MISGRDASSHSTVITSGSDQRVAVLRRVQAVVAVLVLVIGLSACGGASGDASQPGPASVSPSPAVGSSTTILLAQFDTISSWAYEPEGPVPTGDGTLVLLVHASEVAPGGEWMRFDAVQGYRGHEAEVQSQKDGKAEGGGFVYYRNGYVHSQRLPLASGCAVAYVRPTADTTVWLATPLEPRELQERVATGGRYFWMMSNGREITGLLQRYSQ